MSILEPQMCNNLLLEKVSNIYFLIFQKHWLETTVTSSLRKLIEIYHSQLGAESYRARTKDSNN